MTEAEIMIEDERRKEKEEETQIGTEMTGEGRETETMTGGGRRRTWETDMFKSKLKSTQMNIF